MPHQSHAALALVAALCFGCLPASAESPRWYEVELLIFSQPPSAKSDEQWPALPQLAYPEDARFLIDAAQVASQRAEYSGPTELDALGRLWLKQSQPEEVTTPPESDADTETDSSEPLEQADDVTTAQPDLTPLPFLSLPVSGSEMSGKTAYMQRRGGYRVLFHQRWAQPMRGEREALPIVIDRSGDSGDWPALQGSVKIHIARFLHVETNLWLNTQGEYLPQNGWRMPAAPLGPPSLIIEEPMDPDAGEEIDTEAPQDPITEALLTDQEEGSLAEPEARVSGPVYPWRHAVLVQQNRRMRSNEIHYLDHPLLGVVIRFTPLGPEALAELAEKHPGPAPVKP